MPSPGRAMASTGRRRSVRTHGAHAVARRRGRANVFRIVSDLM